MTDAAPPWWHCDTHGPGKHNAWGCPECVREMRSEISRLKASERSAWNAAVTADERAEAAEKDAARYRKWRSEFLAREAGDMLYALAAADTPGEVDAAIDAAIAAT